MFEPQLSPEQGEITVLAEVLFCSLVSGHYHAKSETFHLDREPECWSEVEAWADEIFPVPDQMEWVQTKITRVPTGAMVYLHQDPNHRDKVAWS